MKNIFKKKTEYIQWNTWKGVVDYVSAHRFMQSVRYDNIRARG